MQRCMAELSEEVTVTLRPDRMSQPHNYWEEGESRQREQHVQRP